MKVGIQATLPRFTYKPLYNGRFRLLSLTDMSMNGTPIYSLVDVASDEKAPILRSVLCWGSNARNRSINCNGKEIQVTQSVFEALAGLTSRLKDENMLIWIDSLCSNQADDVEKACQNC